MLLRLGRVDDALTDIDGVLAVDSADGEANALRAIIQIAKNDKSGAIESATSATTSSPNSMRAWLALSYAQQASFELDRALESAKKAQALEPHSSLVNARVAELLMSLGRNGDAEDAARAAVSGNPAESRARTVLGFVHLAQINIKGAHADFEAAIERDSFDPLPRLGLGLAMIRDGRLVEGREQLEIAVALDPGSSLLRSYVGKAYYEENSKERNELAATQFNLARELDANDPTPWFYDSILKDSQTRPAEALQSLDKSRDLNDDRAVYRSRLQLDQDMAARNASQATVYNELGFHQLGVKEAAQSLALDPASASAHRFLADIYATVPRYEIARASELLQSQLRQPLGAPPLQAQLANDTAFKNTFFGPAAVGLNEFNPLFLQDGYGLQLFGLLGDNHTYGDQAILNGLHGPVSFSLSQFASDTDGYRPNNDDRLRQYDGFVQAQFGANTSAQIEITSADRESGDLQSAFDPEFFSETLRNEDDVDTQRLGVRRVIDPQSDLLLSIIRQDRHEALDIPDPVFPTTILSNHESWKAEAQYMMSRRRLDVILGASYFEGESGEEVISPFFSFATQSEPRHFNAYGYAQFLTRPGLPQIQIGVSYDDLTSDVGEQSEVNPKVGVIWNVTDAVTLRAAAFRVLKRRINSDQGLEPTQLAGLNQFFDDQNGTVSEGGGLSADFAFSPQLTAGLQLTRRNLDVPYFDFTGIVFFQRQREDVASGYLYWLPSRSVSVALEPRYQDFDQGATFETMQLTEIPLSLKFVSRSGAWIGVTATGVEQQGQFDGPGGVAEGSDTFWLLDAIVAYRLPRRMGTVSVEGTNLLDEEFQFQEIDQAVQPRYVPETQILLRISVSF
jgi:Tfp pilus assembly protein PilF